jgi:hypothetical protein
MDGLNPAHLSHFIARIGQRHGIGAQLKRFPANLEIRVSDFQTSDRRLAEPAEGSYVIGEDLKCRHMFQHNVQFEILTNPHCR